MSHQIPYLRLNRLRVIRRGHAVYDQVFHDGINIIRGQNGSGKSTIADFIFYVLGGEYGDWKEAAQLCDEVQAEITTTKGSLTLKRAIDSKTTPVSVYFGPMIDAETQGIERWETFPIRRSNGRESFSQVMFRSMSIPEAQSEGASNITMHQLLRLCYSDQRTPAPRLFRFESFDTPGIREAVGDLMCGLSGYEIYEIGLRLRELNKELDSIRTNLNGLLKALPPDDALRTTELINDKLRELAVEKAQRLNEIQRVDDLVEIGEVKEHFKDRRLAQDRLSKRQTDLDAQDALINILEFEIREISEFQDYLTVSLQKLLYAEESYLAIGTIDFTHCPACGEKLNASRTAGHCVVCNSPTDLDKEKSRYNKIRLDLEIQARESKQLLLSKVSELEHAKRSLQQARQKQAKELSEFEIKYSGSNGPREAFLAERTTRIGHIEAETNFLIRSLGIASEIDSLNQRKQELEAEYDKLKQRESGLNRQAEHRRTKAFSEISEIGASILRDDLEGRQDEFKRAQAMKVNFADDAVFVDGKINFAESSNVFLKNTAIVSILLAAGMDTDFFHPRFLLLDNIEDKGMEVVRSHLFQEVLVKRATEIEVPYQIIFTTSMMNPRLELQEYTIGPAYSKNQRTLKFAD